MGECLVTCPKFFAGSVNFVGLFLRQLGRLVPRGRQGKGLPHTPQKFFQAHCWEILPLFAVRSCYKNNLGRSAVFRLQEFNRKREKREGRTAGSVIDKSREQAKKKSVWGEGVESGAGLPGPECSREGVVFVEGMIPGSIGGCENFLWNSVSAPDLEKR